ncbi:hypothetical protein TVAG_478270 [Trichomonas vaginalis G3]|uniref:Uncharacterized protein n=1 Tax=Trichomonas vaginalis (strain ATCC PRA-98 / G3) TaxID=412133 RepID=A2DZU3_TRIV3|nr:hypothetical protein TVAGG3_0536950 [Trichomonas vaginalis G3]EAY14002.1 hypothetical protein TVAG_478270 [Trichomonas vaginalis G3]KAI5519564.1 hypothetical protein TVAGG3_0536950 [Trichomonas vaginalis G3]|eukprot:XP_001326225.1 hypothetical protein [Trichomonas vaginalis G3]
MNAQSFATKLMKNTVLASQMGRLRDCIHFDANEMFANIPIPITTGKKDKILESEIKYQQYLSRDLVTNFNALNILDSLAQIGSNSATSAFEEFAADLPELDINKTDEVETDSGVDLTLRFDKEKFKVDNMYHRIAFNVYFNQVLCAFTKRLMLASKLSGDDKMEEIINQIPQLLQKYLNSLSGPIFAFNAKLWSEPLCLLSKVNLPAVLNSMEKNIPDPSTDTPLALMTMFNLYSQVVIDKGADVSRIINICHKYEKLIKNTKPDAIHHNASIEWLMNISLGVFILDPSQTSSQFIYDMSEIAKKFQGNNKMADPSEAFRAHIYAFSNHPKLHNPLDEYFTKYIGKDPKYFTMENAPIQLRAISALICGKSYFPPFIRQIQHSQYAECKSAMSVKIASMAFQLIFDHQELFDSCQLTLSETLTCIAAADFQDFVTKKLKELFHPDFLTNNCFAVFDCLHQIISPASRFQDLTQANIGLFSDLFNFVSSHIETILEKIPTKSGNVVYKSIPLYDSLTLTPDWENVILPPKVDKKLELCLYNMKDTNFAVPLILRAPIRFSAKDTKPWTSVLAKFYESSVFESITDVKLNVAELPPNELTQELSCISLIPFFKSETFIEKLALHINIANPHISSACLRTLQSILIHNPQSADSIIGAINNNPIYSLEDLYNNIQALTNVMSIIHIAKAELKQQSLLSIFSAIITGLCTPTPAIRILAMQLAQEVSSIGKVHPNFLAFLDENSSKISTNLKHLIITHGNYSHINITNVPEITFQSLIPTGYDSIYSCALSILGQVMSGSNIAVEAEQTILNIVSNTSQIKCPLFLINVYIFVSALSKGNSVATKINEIHELLSKPEGCEDHLLPFLAFYTSGFGVPILKNLQPNGPFMSHVISFTFRNLIEYDQKAEETGLTKFDHIISLALKNQAFDSTPTFKINEEYLSNNQHVIYALCDIAYSIKKIYDDLYQNNISEARSAFPRNTVYGGEKLSSDAANRLFACLVNCSSAPDKLPFQELRTICRSALTAMIRVYTIPDSLFNSLKDNLNTVSEISFSVLTSVLGSAYNVMLPLYIERSIDNPIFFKAICAQFMPIDNVEKFILKWKSNVSTEFNDSEKDFNETTNANIAGLLTLSFYMLTHSESTNRASAINLLTCVALGALFVSNDQELHGLSALIHRINTFMQGNVTLPPEINLDVFMQISELLSKKLRSSTEIVLSHAAQIIKKKPNECNVFISIMTPWLKGLVFNRDCAGIVPEITDEKLIRFTGFSFLKSFVKNIIYLTLCNGHFKFIDQILESKCEEMDIHQYFFICLYSIQQNDQSLSDNIMAVIDYLFNKDPMKVIEHISKFFTFRSWFYYQIQLLRMDIQFDMDRFMENIAHTNQNSNEDSEEDVSDIDLFQVVITFSSKLVMRLFREKPESIKPYLGPIIIFCLLYSDQFEGAPKELLGTILSKNSFDLDIKNMATTIISSNKTALKTTPDKFSSQLRLLSKVTDIDLDLILVAIDFIYSLPAESVKDFATECLRWGTTCGEIKTAHRAIILYGITASHANDDIIDILLRTLYIFISVLAERTAPGWKSKKQQVLATIMEKEFDASLAYSYIADLVDVITKISCNLTVPSQKAFLSVIQLLKVQREEHLDIFMAVINHLSECLSNKQFTDSLQNENDYLQLILTPYHSTQSLKGSVNFMVRLPSMNGLKCISNLKMECLLLAVLPYLFTFRHDRNYAEHVESFRQNVDSQLSDMLQRMANEGDDVLDGLVKTILKIIDDQTFLLSVLNFYTTALQKDSDVAVAIYKIVTIMLKMTPLPITIDRFGGIGDVAASVTDPLISVYAIEFLKLLQAQGGGVMKKIVSRGIKQFPSIDLPVKADQWKFNEEIDPFDDIKELPPLAIIDIEYYGCEFLQPIQETLPIIKVAPFTFWANATFKAENMHVQEKMLLELDAVKVNEPEKFFNKLEKALVNDDESDDEDLQGKKSTDARSKKKNFAQEDQEDDEEETKLTYQAFLPSNNEINALGSDILSGIEFPSFL